MSKITQKIISQRLGISDSLLSRILSDERIITYKLAKKIASLSDKDVLFWMEAPPEELKQAFSQLNIKKDEAA